jgi:RNA polymerase sigma factor (sigma-70 family)
MQSRSPFWGQCLYREHCALRVDMSPPTRIILLPGPAGDRTLVSRLRAGEEQAYRDCYDQHAPRTLALLIRILRNQAKAEEILQETFVAVFRKVGQYRGDAPFGAWISGIAVRRALNALRDDSRRIPSACDGPEGVSADVEGDLTRRDLARRLLALLDRLSEDKRLAILLHAEGYTAAEIGELTGAPRATVLARIARGRAELVSLVTAEEQRDGRALDDDEVKRG